MAVHYRVVTAVLIALIGLFAAGCSTISHKVSLSGVTNIEEVRHIAIFFDGTANDEGSDTNVKRLHSLVTLQKRSDIATLYIQGVGTNFDAVGAATGSGINKRVQIAYEFIQNNYRTKPAGVKPDKLYIFGFSRGAYSARILASLLFHAGLPYSGDRENCHMTSFEVAETVHTAVAPPEAVYGAVDEKKRRQIAQEWLANVNVDPKKLPAAHGCFNMPSPPVEVDVLGLWDTVEALGFADWPSRIEDKAGFHQHLENVDVPNARYGDKLCNIRHAFHAVSIDDNRAWIFTPLLLTRPHQFIGCQPRDGKPYAPMLTADGNIIPGRLKEVWFAGAHSDLGGGYGNSALSGVSLNWMIKQLGVESKDETTHLLPEGAGVREDPFGSSHNPSTGFFNLTYHNIHRDLYRYALGLQSPIGTMPIEPSPVDIYKGTICVHRSVFERRTRLPPQPYETSQLRLKDKGLAHLKLQPIDPKLPWTWYVEDDVLPSEQLLVQRYPKCTNM
jgi:uncharacterized protein (DUF2235 family)